MEQLQQQVFEETEKLIGKFSFAKVVIYTLISAILIVGLMLLLGFQVDTFMISFALAASFIYSFFRDYFTTRYSKKMMYFFYDYMKQKKPRIDLYIPLLQKTRQGYFLKKASLYFDGGDLYLEAFNQVKSKAIQDSISVKLGRDFGLDSFNVDGNPVTVTYEARLMDGEIKFSVVNNTELIN